VNKFTFAVYKLTLVGDEAFEHGLLSLATLGKSVLMTAAVVAVKRLPLTLSICTLQGTQFLVS
jgi:hypothetical protein